MDIDGIAEHMEVVASDGQHIGTVDRVEGNRIKLTKSDPAARGQHHTIPLEWVESVDDKVYLTKSSQDVMGTWETIS